MLAPNTSDIQDICIVEEIRTLTHTQREDHMKIHRESSYPDHEGKGPQEHNPCVSDCENRSLLCIATFVMFVTAALAD